MRGRIFQAIAGFFPEEAFAKTGPPHDGRPMTSCATRRTTWMPKTECIQKVSGPYLMNGISVYASPSNHFGDPKSKNMSPVDSRTKWS